MIPIKVKDLYFLSVIVTIQLANQIGPPQPVEMFLPQLPLCMDWQWRKWIKTSAII